MIFWIEFGVLFISALIGAAAVIPYSLRLAHGKPLKFSKPVLVLLSLAQNAVIFAIAIGVGLLAAHIQGLGAPYIEALIAGASIPPLHGLMVGMLLGLALGALLLIADLFFLPYWPQALRDVSLATTPAENLLASVYGGINEELLMRLFGLSGLIWLVSFVWHSSSAVFWTINVIITIVFGLGHLPALKATVGTMPRLMVVRSLLLNAPIGLACGWLFWTFGIEAAIVAHFFADIVYHVFGTFVLRRKA
jgi:hypothetical protein